MQIYLVQEHSFFFNLCKRTSSLHDTVFHGIGYYPTYEVWERASGIEGKRCTVKDIPDRDWRPAVTNKTRESLHIARSGRFLPPMFATSLLARTLVISPELQKVLSPLRNIAFNDVVFEHLVNLPMPKLGDFSWYDRDDIDKYDDHPGIYLWSLPHVSEFEKDVEGYRQLLPANFYNIEEEFEDIEYFTPDFGSYAHVTSFGTLADSSDNREVPVSKKMMEKYPIVQTPRFIFREDAFEMIAPFLDLDYYAIARFEFLEPTPYLDMAFEGIERLSGIPPEDDDDDD